MTRPTSYAVFLEQKERLIAAIEAAALKSLLNMGSEIQGITWFSSRASASTEDTLGKAA